MRIRRLRVPAAAAAAGMMVTVGVVARAAPAGEQERGGDRGLRFSHQVHVGIHEIGCDECHSFAPGERSLPSQGICEICHETDVESESGVACSFCHTRGDQVVDGSVNVLDGEIRFAHEPHLAKSCSDCHASRVFSEEEMAAGPGPGSAMPSCELCHPGPEMSRLPAEPVGEFCVRCHERMAPSRSECPICHKTVTAEAGPGHGEAGL